jgi:DNA-binding MarR family transcriptional regulator
MSDGTGPTLTSPGTVTPDAPGRAGLSLLLKHADHTIRRRLQPLLDEVDLSLEHWRIMAVLLVQPGLRMSTIADAAVVPAATLTRLMDKLVERGIIVRHIDPADKRRVVAALSPRGETLATRLRDEERAIEATFVEALGGERFATLVSELRLLPHLV